MITQARLKELYCYSPTSGLFTRLLRGHGRRRPGTVADTQHTKHGHIQIVIDGKKYLAHSLAWLYITGSYPDFLIDHEDNCASNNRWRNLRKATYSLNKANEKLRKDNKLGIKGVSQVPDKGFRARICVAGVSIHLGYFSTPKAAASAYRTAAKKYYGEFARFA